MTIGSGSEGVNHNGKERIDFDIHINVNQVDIALQTTAVGSDKLLNFRVCYDQSDKDDCCSFAKLVICNLII